MKNLKYYISFMLLLGSFTSCEDFVDVEVPAHKTVSATVFSNDQSAQSAMQGIYNELSRADFSGRMASAVTVLAGLSADNLKTTTSSHPELKEFYENLILPSNTNNFNLWSSIYNIIYMCNAVVEGVENSDGLSPEVSDRLIGQAKCIRAFGYFYLTNLYGDVPLITSTDYRTNAVAPQQAPQEIYVQMVKDLEDALELLPLEYPNAERTAVNQGTAMALLARVYLYLQDWTQAELLSNEVINNPNYTLLDSLDEVFLANSQEAIWQISPIGAGNSLTNTPEGSFFILNSPPGYSKPVALTESLIDTFKPHDNRRVDWIGTYQDETTTFYYPYKYKIPYATGADYTEYSMVLRLAEQYLIKSEALARKGDLNNAVIALDKIRMRAGLDPLSSIAPNIQQEALLDSIQLEKRREFFTEWGHRWLDLKHTGKIDEVLQDEKPYWQGAYQYYPIPEEDLQNNPYLTQNPGY
ncbi:RagB/SusD family nutrient uptake outer membrane protein [Mesonia sp. K7]|uniref:RagB/SusD family nutrient uptake outer membrane protein n=1 Tax=Mesonia sp. K7 TaxID=2218606 RepID=UPI000DA7B50B|nr:RagB/SusD family nutrient uptake outer membrane protein [Mesonia sp. K7]PZD76445.1 RagB/SusD family nutrient uptake outer membrane protein [Mesonia sp. K7]